MKVRTVGVELNGRMGRRGMNVKGRRPMEYKQLEMLQ